MTAWLRVCVLALIVALTGAPATSSSTDGVSETLTLMLGAGSTLRLKRPFDTILIDNPDVVDVQALSDQLVLLEPLNLGTSNVVFVDERNIAIANIRVVVRDTRSDRWYFGQQIYAGRPVPSLSRHAT
jgi:Flp pilus assembly secretin CpaC